MATNKDCFPIAAVRHFEDGLLLQNNGRDDNAMCHYAFSSECSIKVFVEQLHLGRKTHDILELFDNISSYAELVGLMHPKFALLVGIAPPPEALFDGHPERRYEANHTYTSSELQEAQFYSKVLVDHVITAVLNGQINVQLN